MDTCLLLISRTSILRLRKHQFKRGSVSWCRLDLDFAVVELHDAVDHRQADAGPRVLRREGQVGNLAQVLGRDTDTGIFDLDLDPGARRGVAVEPAASRPSASPDSALSARLSNAWRSIPGIGVDARQIRRAFDASP